MKEREFENEDKSGIEIDSQRELMEEEDSKKRGIKKASFTEYTESSSSKASSSVKEDWERPKKKTNISKFAPVVSPINEKEERNSDSSSSSSESVVPAPPSKKKSSNLKLPIQRMWDGSKQTINQLIIPKNWGKEQDSESEALIARRPKHKFNIGNIEIESYIQNTRFTQPFQEFWGFVVYISNAYNFFSCFYRLGVPSTPQGYFLGIELLVEFLLLSDLILRVALAHNFPEMWAKMWLLKEKNHGRWWNILSNLLASFPQSVVLLLAGTSYQTLCSLEIALFRCIKLGRSYQMWIYFEQLIMATKRHKIFSHIKTFQVVFNLILAACVIGSSWLLTYRVEPKKYETWYSATHMEDASNTELFVDGVFYVVATMTGLGYGDVIPITYWETLVCLFIMFLGVTIFSDFFGRFAAMMYHSNAWKIENRTKLEQAIQFADQRNLPTNLKNKIYRYYTFMRLKYGQQEERYELMHQLPVRIRTQFSLFINHDLIKNVRLFQIADPAFIMAVTRELRPKQCQAEDYVIRKGEIAEELYFIKKGIVKVLCNDDESTVLAYMAEGCYFGEIGILANNQKRSASVKAEVNCLFATISREKILEILERFPVQKKFLEGVASQRLKTTYLRDLITHNGDINYSSVSSNSKARIPMAERTKRNGETSVKTKPWLTNKYTEVKTFLIFSGSKVYQWFSKFLLISLLWNMFYVPFSIAFERDAWDYWPWMIIEVFSSIILIIDIWFRTHVPYKNDDQLVVSRNAIMLRYLNSNFLIDFISTFPIDYLLLPFGFGQQYIAFFRLGRTLRSYRLAGILNDLQKNSKIQAFNLVILMFVFIYASHFFGCIYFFIGKHEVNQGRRFDNKTWFEDLPSRSYFTDHTPMLELTVFSQYVHSVYLSCCTMGTVMYGEIIPFAMSERIYSFLVMFSAKIFLSFTYAEASSYVRAGTVYYTEYIRKKEGIRKWMQLHSLPKTLIKRVDNYQDILWKNFKGIDDMRIMGDLPVILRDQVSFFLFQQLVESVALFPKDNPGALSTIIRKLKLWVIPKGEFILQEGELANEMYFILQGVVEIYNLDGILLAQLTEGKHFGEMAIFNGKPSLRNASALCTTEVSVAILTLDDLILICELYPDLKKKLRSVVNRRSMINEVIKFKNTGGDSGGLEENVKEEKKEGQRVIKMIHQKQKSYRGLTKSISPKSIEEFGNSNTITRSNTGSLAACGRNSIEAQVSEMMVSKSPFRRSANNLLNIVDPPSNPPLLFLDSELLPATPQLSNLDVKDTSSQELEKDGEVIITHKEIKDPKDSNTGFFLPSIKKNTKIQPSINIQVISPKVVPQAPVITPTNINSDQSTSMMEQGHSERFSFARSYRKEDSKGEDKNVSKRRRSRTSFLKDSIRRPSLRTLTKIANITAETTSNSLYKFCSCKNYISLILAFLVIYSAIFIPFQFAFRIKYRGIFLAIEIIIIIFYFLDLIRHIIVFKRKIIDNKVSEGTAAPTNSTQIDDYLRAREHSKQKRHQILKIVQSLLATIPFGLFFEELEIYSPTYIICAIKLLRMMKIAPFFIIFQYLKKIHMNGFRLIQAFVTYYLLTHTISCLFIVMMYWEDINETWVRRVPYPYPEMSGFREGNNRGNVTDLDIYNHALYWGVNTVSHVAIGDVTAVSVKERIFVGFAIFAGTFIYAFIFGNVVSLVSDLAEGLFHNFHVKNKSIMEKMDNNSVPPSLIHRVREYFDEEWAMTKGMEENLINDLPHSIILEIQVSRYSKFIKKCFLFQYTELDVERFGGNLIDLMEIKTYVKKDIVIHGGELSNSIYFLLDGEIYLVGLNNAKIGRIMTGGFIPTYMEKRPIQRRIANCMAMQTCSVGILSQEKITLLLDLYPQLAEKLNFAANFIFDCCVPSFESYIASLSIPQTLQGAREELEHYYTFSDSAFYEKNIVQPVFSDKTGLRPANLFKSLGVKYEKEIIDDLAEEQIDNIHQLDNLREQEFRREFQNITNMTKFNSNKVSRATTSIYKTFYSRSLLSEFYFAPHSQILLLFEFMHLIIILYSIFAITFTISFDAEMNGGLLVMEIISIIECSWFILLNFRIVVLTKKGYSRKLREIYKYYRDNGLFTDIVGIMPFNLVFGLLGIYQPLYIITPLRLMRCWLLVSAPRFLTNFEMVFRKFSPYLKFLKTIGSFGLLAHCTSCAWFYTNKFIEDESDYTWIKYQHLEHEKLYICYLMSIYYVINVVTSCGYGDMFPMTNKERIFTCLMINTGDLLFAVIFGIVAALAIASKHHLDDFFNRMSKIADFIRTFKIEEDSRKPLEEYFAFVWQSSQKNHATFSGELKCTLPCKLAQELSYVYSKDLLYSMFSSFQSENFLREISVFLSVAHFMPGDYIVFKDDIGDEMYFIVNGEVAIIASDKSTLITILGKGSYFGEIAILIPGQKRICYVKADTYCTICTLKKVHVDKIALMFPSVGFLLKQAAKEKMKKAITKFEQKAANINMNERRFSLSYKQYQMQPTQKFSRQTNAHRRTTLATGGISNNSSSRGLTKNYSKSTTEVECGGVKEEDLIKTSVKEQRMVVEGKFTDIEEVEHGNTTSSNSSEESEGEDGVLMALDMVGNKIVVEEDEQPCVIRREEEGGKRERRLSRLTLGKNMALNESAGFELQWSIGLVGDG